MKTNRNCKKKKTESARKLLIHSCMPMIYMKCSYVMSRIYFVVNSTQIRKKKNEKWKCNRFLWKVINNIGNIIWRNIEWIKPCINVHENKNVHFCTFLSHGNNHCYGVQIFLSFLYFLWTNDAVMLWLLLLQNFSQWSESLDFDYLHILQEVCKKFTMVRTSINILLEKEEYYIRLTITS